ncbi:MAG: ImmA/IrrE family metallo-endopeptidase [Kiritimatiellae bacterium]|nr:ImmA/IrrE family metallo-endopeptidase [Kiritimatiellia bacterium]
MRKGEDFRIGGLIRAWRVKRNLIQKELAGKVGMNVTQMWSIENDRNSPSLRTVGRIAEALDLTIPELLRPPEEGSAEPLPRETGAFNMLRLGETDLKPIMRPDNPTGKGSLSPADRRELEARIGDAFQLESDLQAELPTTLPLTLPFTKSEAGARQLANAVRAHCNAGSAIIQNIRALFEIHGIRILTVPLPPLTEAVTFYDPLRRNFTVFLSDSKTLKKCPWHRDFLFLSEIGRMFLFAANGFRTFRESASSNRFAHHFAATFQMPEQAIRATVYNLRVHPEAWTYDLLLRLRDRFGVSATAFNIRLKELGLISQHKHTVFANRIDAYYKKHGYQEPPAPQEGMSDRLGDLLALHRKR